MSEANEVDGVVKSRVIDRAIKFYEQCPTGQYDEEAVYALKYCRTIIDDGFYNVSCSLTGIEELHRIMCVEI